MSDKTNPAPAVVPTDASAPESSTDVTLVEKKPNPFVRLARKVKSTPPKTALAVVGGVGLVALGAALGRSTASTHLEIVSDDYEPEPILVTGEVVESNDTQTA